MRMKWSFLAVVLSGVAFNPARTAENSGLLLVLHLSTASLSVERTIPVGRGADGIAWVTRL